MEALQFSADGRTIAASDIHGSVSLWETATDHLRVAWPAHPWRVCDLAQAANGRTLVTADLRTALAWDIPALVGGGVARRGPFTPEELDDLWADLGAQDGVKAFKALWAMAGSPPQSLPLLKQRLPTTIEDMGERMERWLLELGARDPDVRKRAAEDLDTLGVYAEPGLKRGLVSQPSEEVRKNVGQMLAALPRPVTASSWLRAMRAVELLERIGTPEARQLLEQVARGAPGARLTLEAKASLERLGTAAGTMP
jgi:hypothetical protein